MLLMFFIRFFVFHLYESPKYLMGRGRDEEAVEVVRKVAAYNGRETSLTVEMLKGVEREFGVENGGDEAGEAGMDTSAKAAESTGRFPPTPILHTAANEHRATNPGDPPAARANTPVMNSVMLNAHLSPNLLALFSA